VVDDQPVFHDLVVPPIEQRGHTVYKAFTVAEAREKMAKFYPDVVLMDRVLPDGDGAELVTELKEIYPDSEYLVITGEPTFDSAFSTGRHGVAAYLLKKPIDQNQILLAIEKGITARSMADEAVALQAKSGDRMTYHFASGELDYPSPKMRRVTGHLRSAAADLEPVLITGEAGSGRQILAWWIHLHSARAEGNVFEFDCLASDNGDSRAKLLGSLGTGKQDQTGKRRQRGLLSVAGHGTLFLRNVELLAVELQVRLRIFIQTGVLADSGHRRPLESRPRIIASADRGISKLVRNGMFDAELYEMLCAHRVVAPALRERREDIPRLVKEMLELLCSDLGIDEPPTISGRTLSGLEDYGFPGNLLELRLALERALIVSQGPTLEPADLGIAPAAGGWKLDEKFDPREGLSVFLQRIERGVIEEALNKAGSRSAAAELLGIDRHQLRRRMLAIGLD